MMNAEQAIDRGVSREMLAEILTDGIEQQGLTPREVYNMVRMSLAYEYGEKEYFAIPEVATMLDMTEAEMISQISKTRATNEAVLHGCRLLFPDGIK